MLKPCRTSARSSASSTRVASILRHGVLVFVEPLHDFIKHRHQNGRTVVSGKTQYGKITAFFSKDGHSSIVWTNGKDVVLHLCASETVLATQPPLQESRSEADAPADGDAMLRNQPTETDATASANAASPPATPHFAAPGQFHSRLNDDPLYHSLDVFEDVTSYAATFDLNVAPYPTIDPIITCRKAYEGEVAAVNSCMEHIQGYYESVKLKWSELPIEARKLSIACGLMGLGIHDKTAEVFYRELQRCAYLSLDHENSLKPPKAFQR